MSPIALDLSDPALFGNDAGEEEQPEVLASYFVDKPQFAVFSDPARRLAIVRARKGMGKSALLYKVANETARRQPEPVSLYVRGADIVALGHFDSLDPSTLINQWQQAICARVNLEIGSRLGIAVTDDTMAMVEGAELAGFRDRNLVGALMDRLRPKLGAAGTSVEPQKLAASAPAQLLSRYTGRAGDVQVWLFIDDVDGTFMNTPEMRLRTSTFFSACRKLVTDVRGIYLRASVRTDVWTEILRSDEALDKCEQYMVDIRWTETETRAILGRKVLSYLRRTFPPECCDVGSVDKALQLVFPSRIPWGASSIGTALALHILSSGRPRWGGQLCRLAGHKAHSAKAKQITRDALNQAMKEFGKLRLDDLYREHSHQFSDMVNLIEAFRRGPSLYTTEAFLERIETRYIKRVAQRGGVPPLHGVPGPGEMDLGAFLYTISFVNARVYHAKGKRSSHDHFSFEERPELLHSIADREDGAFWEIQPCYRTYLETSIDTRRDHS